MVCNRCGAEIPPGYAWCIRCETWAQVQQGGWPYATPGNDPRQMTAGQRYNVPGYYYQAQPATPGAQWPQGYGYYQQQGWEAVREGAYVRGGASLVYSLVTLACGLAVILSTFLPWASMLGFNVSGWRMMSNVAGSDNGNFLFAHGDGMLVFTGFWSLLVGVAIAVGITVLLSGRRAGAGSFDNNRCYVIHPQGECRHRPLDVHRVFGGSRDPGSARHKGRVFFPQRCLTPFSHRWWR